MSEVQLHANTQQATVIRSYAGTTQEITSLLGIFHQQYYFLYLKDII
jgi:hypothetical protein